MFSRRVTEVASKAVIKKLEPVALNFFKQINLTGPTSKNPSPLLSEATKTIINQMESNQSNTVREFSVNTYR